MQYSLPNQPPDIRRKSKELLEKYGAQQLKQVNPDDYAAILKEAEVIGNA